MLENRRALDLFRPFLYCTICFIPYNMQNRWQQFKKKQMVLKKKFSSNRTLDKLKNYGVVFIILLTTLAAQGQIVNIPDANFKNALLNNDPVIDTNGDNEIQLSEAIATESISVSGQNIVDITGIESFINLEFFLCANNQIAVIDLSSNTSLQNLQCQTNNYTELNLSNNIQLSYLNCGASNLNNLQLPNTTSQIAVYCTNSQLTDLDVSSLPNLIVLAANGNNLSSINLSNNTNLEFLYLNNNNLENINLQDASNLKQLFFGFNPIENIDISDNLDITTLVFESTEITTLDLSNHNQLIGVFGNDNSLESINLKNNSNSILTNLDLTNNPNLDCIQVDDEKMANNSTGSYELWVKDSSAIYSEDCQALGVDEKNLLDIAIYPNPTISILNIDSSKIIDKIVITNSLGQIIDFQSIDSSRFEYSLANINSGIYFVKLYSGHSFVIKTIIKK